MTTTYEFVLETLDFYPGCGDDPDIIDCCFFPSMAEAIVHSEGEELPWRIALVRDTGNELEGLTERYYAYPDEDGKLSGNMETATGLQDGPPIPKRFLTMVFPCK